MSSSLDPLFRMASTASQSVGLPRRPTGVPMKLRDHPSIAPHAWETWPPVQGPSAEMKSKFLWDQRGQLKYVYAKTDLSNRCFLVAECENKKFVGSLIFNDKALCVQITTLLTAHIGCAINEIGDLEIPSAT